MIIASVEPKLDVARGIGMLGLPTMLIFLALVTCGLPQPIWPPGAAGMI